MNLNEVGSKQQQYGSSAVAPATGSRSQHAPQGPPYFGSYPGRVPPPSNFTESLPPQHFAGYPQPRQPFPGSERDEREHRYERSNLPPPPASSTVYQNARSSSQEYYPRHNPSYPAGGPPPRPRPPPPLESRFDLRDRQGNTSANVVSQGDPYPSQKDPYSARPYGAPYPQGRPHNWGNGEAAKRYPETYRATGNGPYTSAQRTDGNDKEKNGSSEEGGIAKFHIIGNSGSPAASQKALAYTKAAPDPESSTTTKSPQSKNSFDADTAAYNGVDGTERSISPSQIDLHRRDDVSNMGCTCKKSKCLKLYCVCFGASVMCGVNCRCLNCHNTPNHEQSRKDAIRCILARNPSAFDTKFKKAADARVVTTNKGLAHKLGCKCRKSFCTKKVSSAFVNILDCFSFFSI